ncbi:hypothetical protein M2316_004058 [Cellulosimicrobium cellulans]|nr:hypothetical protein [Cellulosimicrobium cellulans]
MTVTPGLSGRVRVGSRGAGAPASLARGWLVVSRRGCCRLAGGRLLLGRLGALPHASAVVLARHYVQRPEAATDRSSVLEAFGR